VVNETDPERKILQALRQHTSNELCTKEVAKLAKLSSSTTVKYLGLLEKDGKVVMREQRPFKFWKLRIKKEEEI
jgi:response regulator of citrate/malate metabolism